MRTIIDEDPRHRSMFVLLMLQLAGNITLKIIIGIATYFFITRYASFDIRQLVAVVIALIAAGRVNFKIKT